MSSATAIEIEISPDLRDNLVIFNDFLVCLRKFQPKINDTITSLTSHPNSAVSILHYQDFPTQLHLIMIDFYNQHQSNQSDNNYDLFRNLVALHMGFD